MDIAQPIHAQKSVLGGGNDDDEDADADTDHEGDDVEGSASDSERSEHGRARKRAKTEAPLISFTAAGGVATRRAHRNARCLKLVLSDGHCHVAAIEWRALPFLAAPDAAAVASAVAGAQRNLHGGVGAKLALHNVPISRGILLLDAENTKLL